MCSESWKSHVNFFDRVANCTKRENARNQLLNRLNLINHDIDTNNQKIIHLNSIADNKLGEILNSEIFRDVFYIYDPIKQITIEVLSSDDLNPIWEYDDILDCSMETIYTYFDNPKWIIHISDPPFKSYSTERKELSVFYYSNVKVKFTGICSNYLEKGSEVRGLYNEIYNLEKSRFYFKNYRIVAANDNEIELIKNAKLLFDKEISQLRDSKKSISNGMLNKESNWNIYYRYATNYGFEFTSDSHQMAFTEDKISNPDAMNGFIWLKYNIGAEVSFYGKITRYPKNNIFQYAILESSIENFSH